MDCPTCNSRNTKKLSMIYAQGITNYNSITSGSRAPFSQSALAAAAAPPTPSRIPKIVAFILALIFILPSLTLAFSDGQYISIWIKILAIITLIISSPAINFIYNFLNKPYEMCKADWGRAWICLRCGRVYDPFV